MNCREAQDLIDAYVDDELDLAHGVEVERHVAECAGCARARDARLALRGALHAASLHQPPPESLRTSVRTATVGSKRTWTVTPWSWLGIAAVAALLAIVFWPRVWAPSREQRLLDELASAHVRSLLADHLMDVVSTDQHTVKPWFEGKIDYAPPVPDFSERGFALIGGRLDYVGNKPVAALVYRHQKHVINVFIWPAGSAAPATGAPRVDVVQGFNVVRWTKSGMDGAAVSDMNSTELNELVSLIAAAP